MDFWLSEQELKARHEAIACYAAEMAGTDLDLDTELEATATEHLIRATSIFQSKNDPEIRNRF